MCLWPWQILVAKKRGLDILPAYDHRNCETDPPSSKRMTSCENACLARNESKPLLQASFTVTKVVVNLYCVLEIEGSSMDFRAHSTSAGL